MLKLIFYSILTMMSVGSWQSFQFAVLLGTFMFGLLWSSGTGCWGLGWGLGLDMTSAVLILLSFWIMSLVVLASQAYSKNKTYPWVFLLVNSILMSFLFLTFSSKDYFSFYIYFEGSLGPTMVLILGWGYQPERLQAGVYMLFYTLFASLPLLASILNLSAKGGTSSMELLELMFDSSEMSVLWYVCSVFAFLVKLPVYSVHLWLPKAHVEAPVAGSMVLAGVLLKLGGYGLLRILPVFSKKVLYYSWFNLVLGVLGGVVVSLVCLRQTDVKSLIAYSSVAHMGMVLSGLVTLSVWGLKGAIVVMVGHGLCSSGLFCLANIGYERSGSRSFFIGKGLLNFMPSMGLWWFLLTIGNMGAPPTLNMVGEIQIIIGLMSWGKEIMWSLFLLLFFSVTYSLYMYSLTQHGKYLSAFSSCCSGNVREYLLVMLHWLPLNFLFLKGDLLI